MLFHILVFLSVSGPAAPQTLPPCATCVTWEMTPAQAVELLESAGPLQGLDVLIRPAAQDADPAQLLADLTARGARAGLVLSSTEGVLPAARAAGRVVLDLEDGTGEDVDGLAFEIKRWATEVRAGNAGAEIGLETDPHAWEALDKKGVGAYLDFLVGPAGLDGAARLSGPIVWIRTEPLRSVESLDLRFASVVDVVGERWLTAEEVVARHQAAAARQRDLVGRLISSGSMVVTFQVPGLAAPMALTSDVVVYEGDGSREIEQRSVRLNGVEYAADAAGVPRLPLLEPERVSAPPLAITLDAAYRYRLEGRETAEGQDCYVVGFAPVTAGGRSLRGRAWIDSRTFGMVRAEAVQTGLRGPIVSSEQREAFMAVPVGDGVAWLPWRSQTHQVYEGPGHRTPIDRTITLTRLQPNPPDFAARRGAAHASSSILVADTPEGFRYLRRVEDAAGRASPLREPAGKATRVRTMAVGVLVDPQVTRPLPFAGLGYVDFDFLGTGTQVNGFFGGVFAQLAWTVPSLGGSRWQVHGSGLAVLASYNDRAFAGGVERHEQNLRQRPARIALGAARPLGGRTRLRVGYELDYTRLERAETTAADFVVPASPVEQGIRVALEAQRGAWSADAWWSVGRRQGWRAWGFPGAVEPAGRDFQRFGASAGRSFVLPPKVLARVEASWMGGRGLDRFSRYGFDGFQNRLRGYPAATVRYDRGAVGHGVLTWNAARALRLDGFLDVARVRDAGWGPRSRTYVGVGAAVEAPLPMHALASVEWGYGFQARGAAGETGTHVVRVTAYKTF